MTKRELHKYLSGILKQKIKNPNEILSLYVEFLDVTDTEFLKYFPNLEHFNAVQTRIHDLSGLRFVPNLKRLYLYKNRETSLNGVQHCKDLEYCYLQFSDITSLQYLDECKNLSELVCCNCGVEHYDLSGYEKLKKFGMPTNRYVNSFKNSTDYPTFKQIPKLPVSITHLVLSHCGFKNLSGIEHLINLEFIECDDNNGDLVDVSAIENLENLHSISFTHGSFEKIKTKSKNVINLNFYRCEKLNSVDIVLPELVKYFNVYDTKSLFNYDFILNTKFENFLVYGNCNYTEIKNVMKHE
jgi:Leucine-rich repeat (LRR) protein